VKPGDHPDFFRLPAPEGRSRESSIRLDAHGRFWHAERPVEHGGLAAALHTWIRRHPDDGRYILSNGYDWTYFTVDDAPYFVRRLRIEPERLLLELSDASEEALQPETARIGEGGALYATVKRDAPGGPYEAKFTRHAQASLAPVLVEVDGRAGVRVGAKAIAVGPSESQSGDR